MKFKVTPIPAPSPTLPSSIKLDAPAPGRSYFWQNVFLHWDVFLWAVGILIALFLIYWHRRLLVQFILFLWDWYKPTAFIVGTATLIFAAVFVCREYSKPGTAIMFGDLSSMGGSR